MIKDITIGQYFPGNSVIHRNGRTNKNNNDGGFHSNAFRRKQRVGTSCGHSFYYSHFYHIENTRQTHAKKLEAYRADNNIHGDTQSAFYQNGKAYFEWKFLKITDEGVDTAVFMMIRIICLIVGTSLLTYTTSPIDLTDAIERLLSPLKKIKVPVHELAMMMTIALRFIPTLIEETDKIMSAQKARGADMETGSLIQKAKALIPVLIPLFVASFRHAEELALAMECRCYHGGEGRTRMKQLHMSIVDLYGSIFCVLFLAGVIVINIVV